MLEGGPSLMMVSLLSIVGGFDGINGCGCGSISWPTRPFPTSSLSPDFSAV